MKSHLNKYVLLGIFFMTINALILTSCDEINNLLDTDVVAVTGASIDIYEETMEVGDTLQIEVAITPADATDQSVTWDSSEETVASVTSNGLVTALSAGTSTITVTTTDGDFTDSAAITVNTATPETISVTGVSVTPESSTLDVDDTVQLEATVTPTDADDDSVSWSSSAPTVASVNSESGLVTAIASGTAIITAQTTDGSFTDTTTIAVEVPIVSVTSVEVTPESATLEKGENVTLTATVSPTTASNTTVTWSSSNTDVATVDSYGVVTALGGGDPVTITATTDDGDFTDTASITVTVPVTSITVSPESDTLEEGETLQLTADVDPDDADNSRVTWSSSDESVATVSTTGLVTAIAESTTAVTITAKSNEDETIYDESLITVTAATVTTTKDITVSFEYDNTNADTGYGNIYVIWLENDNGDLQHIFVCNRLLPQSADKTITHRDSTLPFWHLNRYDADDTELVAEVDAVTGATEAHDDFSVTVTIDEDKMGSEFTLYFEMDQSFQYNDAFPGAKYDMDDQPAALFSAEIDLTDETSDYTLTPEGFTPMYDYSTYSDMILTTEDQASVEDGTLTFEKGTLIEKIKYITHSLTTDTDGNVVFDATDMYYSFLRMVANTESDEDGDDINETVTFTGITATISDTV